MPEAAPLNSGNEITNARCPRCGYDLRGVVESWTDSCPFFGVCTECGLEYEWGALLNPERNLSTWCVEYAQGWRIVPASFKTLFRLIVRPRQFWSDVTMNHRPRPLRIAGVLLAAALLLYAMIAVSVGSDMYRHIIGLVAKQGFQPPQPPLIIGLRAAANPFSEVSYSSPRTSGTRVWIIKSLSPSRFASPLYPSTLIQDTTIELRYNRFFTPWRWRRPPVALVNGLATALMCPFVFPVLARLISRKRAPALHVLRIWLYSLAYLTPTLAAYILIQLDPFPFLVFHGQSATIFVFLMAIASLVAWWSIASRNYLHMPRPLALGGATVVLAYLASLAGFALLNFVLL